MRAKFLHFYALVAVSTIHGQARLRVDTTPILDIVGRNGDSVSFEEIVGATRLRDGSFLVADRGSNVIRLLTASGKSIRVAGGRGVGPGEFENIAWASRCGVDSMLVWDLRLSRASMVGPAGIVSRQFRLPADTARGVRAPLTTIACGSSRIAYLSSPTGQHRGASPPGVIRTLASLVVTRRDGSVLSRVDSILLGELFLVAGPTGGRGAFPRPLGSAGFLTAIQDTIIFGSSDSTSLSAISPSGIRSAIRIPLLTRRPPTQEQFRNAVEAGASATSGDLLNLAREQLLRAPVPDLAPAFFGLIADPSGLIWVRTSSPGSVTTHMLAVNLRGSAVAVVEIPQRVNVLEIGLEYILGLYSDSADEQHLVVYRLRRGNP